MIYTAMPSLSKQSPCVSFITLGCAKNEVDTNHMLTHVSNAGFTIIENPEKADAIVVNTCSFIQAATEESIEAILDFADLTSVREGKTKLIVSGCLPARYGNELEKELPEACAFVPCSKEDDIVKVLLTALNLDASTLSSSKDRLHRKEVAHSQHSPSAYLKISDGCDRFCSYCTIPFIRGRYRSFPLEQIFEEAQSLVDAGVRELVLIAQDTGRWGKDFEKPSSLAELLLNLAKHFPDTWLRVMYLQPDGIDEKLLKVIASYKNICSYLDIPLQHVNAQILKAMNRSGSPEELASLIKQIRSLVPGITLRTTLIAGFPGESEEAFEELCDFIETNAFDYVGVFPYSREEGTRAAALPKQLDETTKLERVQILRDIADAIGSVQIAERIGKRLEVLVLGREEEGQLYGRAQCQAPDVDGVTYLEKAKIGDIVTITIQDTLLYEMEGV